jgi:hypothetical protein
MHDVAPGRVINATGGLLERLIRFRQRGWASSLAIVADGSVWGLREYIEQWTRERFLNIEEVRREEARLVAIRAQIHFLRVSKRPPLPSLIGWPGRIGPKRKLSSYT